MTSSSLPPSISSASVRNILALLASRDAQLVAGSGGLERRVTWACSMRARLPAFESLQGGELALLALSQLRRLDVTLPSLLKTLHKAGVAAVAVAAPSSEALGDEALSIAEHLHLPLILLPTSLTLEEIAREMITFVVSFRGETERKATEIAHSLMQLSVQGAGMRGVCEHLANSRNKWVVVQDADQHVRFQSAPLDAGMLLLPIPLTDETLRNHGLTRVVEPILIRHEVVGYLSLIGSESDFDYLERIILGQVAPILALEFARERERSEVESRYQVEAFTDVLKGHYQQPLGPLLAHDARNDGTLVETLEGFFRCNGNLSETARVMHLHRNSLLYRLDRIEAILGRSLEDSELRLSLQIALKIHHLQRR